MGNKGEKMWTILVVDPTSHHILWCNELYGDGFDFETVEKTMRMKDTRIFDIKTTAIVPDCLSARRAYIAVGFIGPQQKTAKRSVDDLSICPECESAVVDNTCPILASPVLKGV